MVFDIFIPSLSLGFEYQGEQHYGIDILLVEGGEKLKLRDQEKLEKCKSRRILV